MEPVKEQEEQDEDKAFLEAYYPLTLADPDNIVAFKLKRNAILKDLKKLNRKMYHLAVDRDTPDSEIISFLKWMLDKRVKSEANYWATTHLYQEIVKNLMEVIRYQDKQLEALGARSKKSEPYLKLIKS